MGLARDWGLGLRHHHFTAFQQLRLPLVIEIMADNLIGHRGGPALKHTGAIVSGRRRVLHSVGLNLGASQPLEESYVAHWLNLVKRFEPEVISDHLSYSRSESYATYELLPIRRSHAALERICQKVEALQMLSHKRLSLENIAAYVDYVEHDYTEPEFFRALVRRTGCGLLLDLNNLYVNAKNFSFDAAAALLQYPLAAVTQVHIAGHSVMTLGTESFLFDTHSFPVLPPVIELLQLVRPHLNKDVPIIYECDSEDASLETLVAQITDMDRTLARPRYSRAKIPELQL